jgi:hypothetical protein
MAVGLPAKTTYANGDVFSASDINDTNGTINLIGQTNNFYAGKNRIINGDFGVWQRGTSINCVAGNESFTADRFIVTWVGTGTTTATRQTFTPGAAPVAGYESTFFHRTTMSSGATYFFNAQKIEDVRTFAGETVTLSFWAKASSAVVIRPTFRQNFGSGGSANVDKAGANTTLTTSWVRYSYTIALDSIAGKTIGTNSSLIIYGLDYQSGTVASNVVDIWGWQIEAGSTATAFETATGTIQGELAACQRYYFRSGSSVGSQTATGVSGITNSTTNLVGYFNPPVPMRVTPTAVEFSSIGTQTTGSGLTAISAVAIVNESTNSSVSLNLTSSGFTANLFGLVRGTTGTGYIGLSAEL